MSDQPAESIDRPACFYLGREYDLATKAVRPDKIVMYDARNLTTHGVIVGMTGSGKTGLSIALLEEAAIDGIPAVIIDPKGDLTNLLLQFPDLDPRDFAEVAQPRRRPAAATSRVDDYAKQLSERWRKGLIETGQTARAHPRGVAAHRLPHLHARQRGGPAAVHPAAPSPPPRRKLAARRPDPEGQRHGHRPARPQRHLRRPGAVARTRPHHPPASTHAWDAGPRPRPRRPDPARSRTRRSAPSARTTSRRSSPPASALKFASQLNNMLASPGLHHLDARRAARPRPACSTATAGRSTSSSTSPTSTTTQRMFFTTLLLEEMLGWTRRQSGTTSLRALLYFDEVFGYMPPHPANPPSKQPLLTLLKQGRAFGVGVLLATQNPVDLDYKALSNAGTWFVGKLQTERDKARLLDGLESVAAEYGTLDRPRLPREGDRLAGQPRLPAARHQPAASRSCSRAAGRCRSCAAR